MIPEIIAEILRHPALEFRIPPDDSARVTERLMIFLQEWEKWNARIDLTSERDAAAVLRKHVFDSLQYTRGLDKTGRILDIGSGGGFPAIPLKIIYPFFPVEMIESQRKRVSFLRAALCALSLPDIEVHHARAEDLAIAKREQFDYVLFKAVAPLPQCLELGAPFLRPGGRLVIKKEPQAEQAAPPPSLRLAREIPVRSYYGIPSSLLIFDKQST